MYIEYVVLNRISHSSLYISSDCSVELFYYFSSTGQLCVCMYGSENHWYTLTYVHKHLILGTLQSKQSEPFLYIRMYAVHVHTFK